MTEATLRTLALILLSGGCHAYDRGYYDSLTNVDATAPIDASTHLDTPADLAVPQDSDAIHCDNDASSGVPDYCAGLPLLASAPTIDGILECGLTPYLVTPSHWIGSNPLPTDVSLSIAVAWNPEGVYVFADVRRMGLYPAIEPDWPPCGDSVEIYVDTDGAYAVPGGYDSPGTRHFVIQAPGDAITPSRTGAHYGAIGSGQQTWASRQFGAFAHADGNGYTVEAFILPADFAEAGRPPPTFAPRENGHVGIDVALIVGGPASDAASCIARLGAFNWNSANADAGCISPACTTAAFCNPTLLP